MSFNYGKPRPSTITYRIAKRDGTSFNNDEWGWIGEGIASMSVLGVTFEWITDGSPVDVVIGHWADDNSTSPEPASREGACKDAGRFTPYSAGFDPELATRGRADLIELDPVGLHGELQWKEAAAHEIGHFLGLEHLTGRFPAIMHPELYGVTLDDFDGMHGTTPPAGPTTVDFDEFDRVAKTVGLPVPRK